MSETPVEVVETPAEARAEQEAALTTALTGEWDCPGCGWHRDGDPVGVITCECCEVFGFDFTLASTEPLPPPLMDPDTGVPVPPSSDPCIDCSPTPEEYATALSVPLYVI